MKFDFKNTEGEVLSGRLELPSGTPKAVALFAHCFTCSKNFTVSATIARSLAQMGIATLRFDFTGLGNSEGDFSNTNFSSNVSDLMAAYEALKNEYQAPAILIGHSLGGAAVLKASTLLDEVKAVVTIGAPSDTAHVSHLFACSLDQIEKDGEAVVKLAGRDFKIKKQFIEDINGTQILSDLAQQKKAYLIMHSPIDDTVSIDHAAKIYSALKHPKSFISLDKADHLLTSKADGVYVTKMIDAWLENYLDSDLDLSRPSVKKDHVKVLATKEHKFTNDVFTPDHHVLMDEPLSVGGNNWGPAPYQMLLASLGGCTSMTLRMYADRKKIPLESVEVDLKHEKVNISKTDIPEMVDVITKDIKMTGDLTEEQKKKLIEISEKCPVNRTLKSDIQIKSLNL